MLEASSLRDWSDIQTKQPIFWTLGKQSIEIEALRTSSTQRAKTDPVSGG